MNRALYRHVFNEKRGQVMAVAESAVGDGKGTGAAGRHGAGTARWARLRRLGFCLLVAFGGAAVLPAAAQVVAYKAAPAAQQATILSAGNGVPLINIQTPSAAGVSHNTYGQFDVGAAGAILNNSRNNVATQLGGWVQGNPWLARGTARVILNEVVSSTPSLLGGYIEVAGDRAQVVVANPAGVTCAGCGFLNAHRATLTTGTPLLSAGTLDGYRVEGGTLRIDGAGLDARGADYTDLIARAVELNAGVWAQTVKVTTGANRVDAAHTQAVPISGAGPAPAFALDVAPLGGMYAGKIVLVGTEAGVGVRNAGTLAASAGEVLVTAEGQLINRGTVVSGESSLTVATRGLDNTGTLASDGNLTVASRGDIDNSGLLHAGRELVLATDGQLANRQGTLDGQRLDLTAGVFRNDGSVRQSGTQALALTAAHLDNAAAGVIGHLAAPSEAGGGTPSGGAGSGSGAGTETGALAGVPTASTAGGTLAVDTAVPLPLADGRIAVGTLANTGTLVASGTFALTATKALDNAGTLTLDRLTATGTAFRNSGTVTATDAALAAATLDNRGGALSVSGRLAVAAYDLLNVRGTFDYAGADALTLTLAGRFDNTEGRFASNGHGLSLSADTVDNTGGVLTLAGDGMLTLTSGQLINAAGTIQGQGAVTVHAGTVNNAAGVLGAQGALVVTAAGLDNTGGRITSEQGGMLTVAGALDNRGGTLASGQALTIQSATLDNRTGGRIVANDALAVTTTTGRLDNAGGTLSAAKALTVTAQGDVANAAGQLVAGTDLTLRSEGALDNTAGTLGAVAGRLDLSAGGVVTNTSGRLEAATDLVLASQGLGNAGGTVLGKTLTVDTHGQALDNTQGVLAAETTLQIDSGALTNTGGLLQAGGALTLDTHGQALTNRDTLGENLGIRGQGAVTLTTGAMDNAAGLVSAGDALALTATTLDNRKGRLVAQAGMRLDATAALDNRDGDIQTAGDLVAQATGRIDNRGGLIRAAQTLALSAATVDNAGTLDTGHGLEGGSVGIAAGTLANAGGAVRANTALTVTSAGTLDNTGGLISSQGTLALLDDSADRTLAVTNTGGTFLAGSALALRAKRLSGDGNVLSHGDLALDLVADLLNTGDITAARDLHLTTAGTVTNRGTVQAGEALALQAAALDNAATGTLAGGALDVRVTGALTNRGLIDGGETVITAGTLDNLGTGRLYGDHLAIAAGTLNNLAEGGTAPVIAARDRLDLGVGSLANRDGALIFSAQDLAIGGGLDADRHASGQATAIDNASATLEALGHLVLDTASLTNRKTAFATATVPDTAPPAGAAPLDYAPGLQFHWPIKESSAAIWRDYVRDRYLNILVKLLGGGPDAVLVALYNPAPADPDAPAPDPDVPPVTPSVRDDFVNVWGDLAGYAGPLGGGLDAATRARLVAAVNAQDPQTLADSRRIWQILLDTLAAERPAALGQLTAALAAQGVASTAYWQTCRDIYDDCSYIDNTAATTTARRDVVTADSPSAVIRAGGAMAIAATALENRYSLIQSGGDMVLTGATLTNVGAELYRVTDTTATTQDWHWVNNAKDSWTSASSTQTLIGSVPGQIVAGGTLTGSFTGRIDNVTVRQNAAPVVGATGSSPGTAGAGGVGQAAGGAGAADAATSAGQAAPRVSQVTAAGGASGPSAVVATAEPTLALPANRLYHTNPASTGGYLVETDPQFASYRSWLSSDYLLQALGLDPALTQKRLGDGFYEQRLITEQIAQLTGRRFLAGYASDEEQYRALMAAGATVAQAWHLIPGVALSEAQMAQLTTDIVWLVEKTVTLADGSTQRVLVPQVYARVRANDLDSSGALIAAENLQLQTAGDLTTSGTIAGRQTVVLTAGNIAVQRGAVAGRDVALQAATDLAVLGGTVEAERTLIATAGRDLTVASSTVDRTYAPSEGRAVHAAVQTTVIDRVAGLYVTGEGGTLVAAAGRDLSLLAAAVANAASADSGGATLLSAGRDLTLGTVTETSAASTSSKGNRWRQDTRTEVGSTLAAAGDLTLAAGNDLTARAASVVAGGALAASAGHDLTITTGEAALSSEAWSKSSKSGFFAKRSKERLDTLDETTAIASTFSGNTVALAAGNDLTVKGSSIVAQGDLTAVAGHDLTITAATERRAETHYHKETESGLFGSGGIGVTIGSRMLSTDQRSTATTAVGSTLGSVEGNVTLVAGNAYTQIGSEVLAPGGDIGVLAKSIAIEEARETSHSSYEMKAKQSGLTVAITSPVISAVQTIGQMAQAASDTSDGRMHALAAASAGLAGYQGYKAIETGQGKTVTLDDGTVKTNQMDVFNDKGEVIGTRDATAGERAGGINLSLSLGTSKSHSMSTATSDTAAGSTLAAGGNVTLIATGGGAESDIRIQGAKVLAGQDVTLLADDAIELLAARNTASQTSKNSSSSASVGVSIGTDGLLFNIGASQGKGKANGSDLAWTNTHVQAGETLTLVSGGDTTLKGAVAGGKQVIVEVGGNLLLESLQDLSIYDSKQSSAGFTLSIGYGKVSGSVSASGSKVESDYASVTEQTGLLAGDGGFNVTVRGNTDLKGADIASTDKAAENGKNQLTTASLTTSDIQNWAKTDASSSGFTVSTDMFTQGKYGMAKGIVSNALNDAETSDSSHEQTRAAVSAATVTITDEVAQQQRTGQTAEQAIAGLNRDVATAHNAAERINYQKLEKTAEAERTIKQEAVKAATLFTDEAYRTSFLEKARMYKVLRNSESGEVIRGADGKPVMVELTDAEKWALRPEPGGKLNIFTNGIFNDTAAAAGYAVQMSELPPGQDIYLMYYPQASNAVSELLVAGYQKFLEGNVGDLANATQEIKRLMATYGEDGLNLVAHSRGAMTVGNAMASLANDPGSASILTNTSIKFVGPAYNTQTAADLLNWLSSGNVTSVRLQNHADDFVGSFIGGNQATNTQRPDESSRLTEWFRIFGEAPTVHSCYGTMAINSGGCGRLYGTPMTIEVEAKTIKR
ncbi:hemagglutinin repeat-containing protein [Propionivibrio sp.]|uniref:hemagglutinin repeat-containing protein n=1 Tax=Propionivibrio sp. TaxID=2212460 RepID=UPI0039E51237